MSKLRSTRGARAFGYRCPPRWPQSFSGVEHALVPAVRGMQNRRWCQQLSN